MELTEQDYILGAWFAEDYQGNNWLMTIKRDKSDKLNWQGEYRFRYRKDNKVFKSADTKTFKVFELNNQTQEQVLKKIEELIKIIKVKYRKYFKYIEVNGDMMKFQFRMAQEPFANVKRVSREDFENNNY